MSCLCGCLKKLYSLTTGLFTSRVIGLIYVPNSCIKVIIGMLHFLNGFIACAATAEFTIPYKGFFTSIFARAL